MPLLMLQTAKGTADKLGLAVPNTLKVIDDTDHKFGHKLPGLCNPSELET